MATFSLSSSTSSTLTVRVTGLPSGTTFVRWYIGEDTSDMPYKGYTETSTTSSSYTFSGLEADTGYYIKIQCRDSSDSTSLGVYTSRKYYTDEESSGADVWQLGNTYTFSNLSTTTSQYLSFGRAGYVARFKLTFAYSGTAVFYTTGDYDTYGYLSDVSTFDEDAGGPTDYLWRNDDGGDDYNFKISYTVTAGEVYYLWVRMVDIVTTGYPTVYITPPAKQISLWDWTASNGSATAAQTKKAYTAITSKGAVSDFSYLVWNDLANKVNSVKAEAGYSWNSKYLTLAYTKMTSSDKTLTADRFNSLRYNIGIHESTGLSDAYTGDAVYGWYFTALTDALNTWIDTLNGS